VRITLPYRCLGLWIVVYLPAEKERQLMYESAFRDVATIVAEKCVNPESNRPYTLSLIERALRDAHFAVHPAKSAKAQALKAIAVLRARMLIERAQMRIRVTVPDSGMGT
jgi:ribosome maturation protein SDO1